MSTATAKRFLAEALADAEAFRALFPSSCFTRWEIAGSVRRGKAEVGDVEHVIIPAFGDVAGAGLFAEPQRANLLWRRLDDMMCGLDLAKHVYGATESGAPMYRWGEKYRGADFRGFNHELFCADETNWGAVLLIRTGPAEFSQRVVTAFRDGNCYRQQDGYLRTAVGEVVKVPDEQTYFRLAGMKWEEPRDRR